MNRPSVISIAVLATVLVGSAAQGQTCNFDVSTGNWGDTSSWDCGHVPTAADLAVIKSGNSCTMNVTAAVADSLTVESTATLNVQAGKKLTLDSFATHSTIAGTVNLQGAGSELAFMDNDQTIDGAGKIVGQHNGAKISITDGEELTNDTTIEGQLQIVGDGNFLNSGTVHANVAGILSVACNSFDDDAGAEWKITTSASAILRIDVADTAAALLEGDWTIEGNGRLDVDSIGFSTEGSLKWAGGTVDAKDGCIAEWGNPLL